MFSHEITNEMVVSAVRKNNVHTSAKGIAKLLKLEWTSENLLRIRAICEEELGAGRGSRLSHNDTDFYLF